MPPCAATVCERVGNTLVMQAVRRPASRAADHGAQARAAGADHDDVVGVVFDRIGFSVGGRAHCRWWPCRYRQQAMGYTPDDILRIA